MLAYRLYRREVTAWISPFSTGSRIQGVLVLLFEAGAVYCAISVVNLAIDVSVSKGSPSSFVVFTSAMFLLAGIYPTLIVVAVMAQQRAAAEASMKGQSNFIGSLRFAGHYDRTAEGDTQNVLLQICVIFSLYGLQTALSALALVALARRQRKTLHFAVIFVASTTATVTFSMIFLARQPPIFGAQPSDMSGSLHVMRMALIYLLSDALVCWRTWVLWRDNRLVHTIIAFCMACTTVGVVTESVCKIMGVLAHQPHSALIVNLPLLVTNAVATGLVGLRLWLYRRNVAKYFSPFSVGSQVQSLMILLVESGLVYCILWIANLVVDSTVPMSSPSGATVYASAMVLLAGIYATLVVVCVMLQQRAASTAMALEQSSIVGSLCFGGSSAESASNARSATGNKT
ncbi:hypothetical protein HDZ31DRAFT_63561 [Schizophyllum fasciatum]